MTDDISQPPDEREAIVRWLRENDKGRGLVDYRHCWNIAAMIERGDHLPSEQGEAK